jgi:hypothetical protein
MNVRLFNGTTKICQKPKVIACQQWSTADATSRCYNLVQQYTCQKGLIQHLVNPSHPGHIWLPLASHSLAAASHGQLWSATATCSLFWPAPLGHSQPAVAAARQPSLPAYLHCYIAFVTLQLLAIADKWLIL